MGAGSRFFGGVALGALEMIVFIATAGSLHDLGLPLILAVLFANGIAAAGTAGFPMLVGSWLGVPLPLVGLAIAGGRGCAPLTAGVASCSQGLYFVFAGLALAAALGTGLPGFLLGRIVRWAVFDPTGEEAAPSVR
jgi:hypothetical protein